MKFEMYNYKYFPRHHYILATAAIHCTIPKNEFRNAKKKLSKNSAEAFEKLI